MKNQTIASIPNIYAAMIQLGGSGTRNQIADTLINEHHDIFSERLENYGGDIKKTVTQIAAEAGSVITQCLKGVRTFPAQLVKTGSGGKNDPFVYSIQFNEEQETEEPEIVEQETEEPEIVEQIAEKYNRNEIERKAKAELDFDSRTRYDDFWTVAKRLNQIVGSSVFDVDHAKTIYEHGAKAIHPDNLQILFAYVNRSKNKDSSIRMALSVQIAHIET
ncbi:MAG: hypothetical protein ACRCYP_01825, partial [Alphaproteobacteria bacterium]